jgi:hypothetical protein
MAADAPALPGGYATLAVFAALLSCACYANSLDGAFVYDDKRAVLANPDVVGGAPLASLWRHDFWGARMRMLGECFEDVADGDRDAWTHNSYRPLTVLTMRLDFALWGAELPPRGFHATNVAVHALAVLAAAWAARLAFAPNEWRRAFAATVLFAVHPVHTEVVANITSRAETLSGLFSLLSMALYLQLCCGSARARRASARFLGGSAAGAALSFACVVLGVLCKETALVVPALLAWTDVVFSEPDAAESGACRGACEPDEGTDEGTVRAEPSERRRPPEARVGPVETWPVRFLPAAARFFARRALAARRAPRRVAACCCFGAAALLFRLKLISCGGYTIDTFLWLHNPTTDRPTALLAFLAVAHVQARAVVMLFAPPLLPLAHEHIAMALPDGVLCWANGLTLAVWTGLALLARWTVAAARPARRRLRAFAVAVGVVAYLPASHLFHATAFVIAERTLFLPSFGAALLVADAGAALAAAAAETVCKRSPKDETRLATRRAGAAMLAAAAACLAAATRARNLDWRDERSLMLSNLAVYPTDNYMAHQGLGAAAVYAGDVDAALAHLGHNRALASRWHERDGRYLLEEPFLLTAQAHWHKLPLGAERSYAEALALLSPLVDGVRYRTLILGNVGLLRYATQIDHALAEGNAEASAGGDPEAAARRDAEAAALHDAEYQILAAAEPSTIAQSPALFPTHVSLALNNAGCVRLSSAPERWGHGGEAARLFARAAAAARAAGLTADHGPTDQDRLENVLHNQAVARAVSGDFEAAAAGFDEALALARRGVALGRAKRGDHAKNLEAWTAQQATLLAHEREVREWAAGPEPAAVAGALAKARMGALGANCEVELRWW